MNAIRQLAALMLVALVLSSCGRRLSNEQGIHQVIPITLQKTFTFEIRALHGEACPVGIRCSSDVWHILTNTPGNIHVHLISADEPWTKIWDVGGNRNFDGSVINFHYLEPVPKVAVLKSHAARTAWWECRERVIHIRTAKKSLRGKF